MWVFALGFWNWNARKRWLTSHKCQDAVGTKVVDQKKNYIAKSPKSIIRKINFAFFWNIVYFLVLFANMYIIRIWWWICRLILKVTPRQCISWLSTWAGQTVSWGYDTVAQIAQTYTVLAPRFKWEVSNDEHVLNEPMHDMKNVLLPVHIILSNQPNEKQPRLFLKHTVYKINLMASFVPGPTPTLATPKHSGSPSASLPKDKDSQRKRLDPLLFSDLGIEEAHRSGCGWGRLGGGAAAQKPNKKGERY